jgi:hypothetical protein
MSLSAARSGAASAMRSKLPEHRRRPAAPHPSSREGQGEQDAADVAHLGTANAAGLYYAACSRDYDEEICGCPICRCADHGRN